MNNMKKTLLIFSVFALLFGCTKPQEQEPFPGSELFPPRVIKDVAFWTPLGTGISDEFFAQAPVTLLFIAKPECNQACIQRLALMQTVDGQANRLFVSSTPASTQQLLGLEDKFPGLQTATAPTASAFTRFYGQLVETDDLEQDQQLPIYVIQNNREVSWLYSGEQGNSTGLLKLLEDLLE